jgi:hypothetical protein
MINNDWSLTICLEKKKKEEELFFVHSLSSFLIPPKLG